MLSFNPQHRPTAVQLLASPAIQAAAAAAAAATLSSCAT